MSAELPVKRTRLEAEAEEQPVTANSNACSLSPDAEFWFDDGNIILAARNVHFKIYRGPLADHSPLFYVMLSLPQPPDGGPTLQHNPCPVIPLSDSPHDVRHMLRALMPRKQIR